MPEIQERFCLIKLLDATELEAAFVRSVLGGNVYIEIEKTFIVSCAKRFKDVIATQLRSKQIKFFAVYVNLKTGCDVKTSGLNQSDEQTLKMIVKDV